MGVNYKTYSNYVGEICKSNNLTDFKSNYNYTYMLEHVNFNEGLGYLNHIINIGISHDEIIEYCMINDKVGNPNKSTYTYIDKNNNHKTFSVSPTSLRYIFHAYLILNHIKTLNNNELNIVEIGGGYGGLCIAVNHFSKKYNIKINSYSIIDLENPSTLQKLYISKVYPLLNIDYFNAINYGSDIEKTDIFLISNYAFSEIDNEHQQLYIKSLFPKISHGFMTWNNIPVYDFGFKITEEPEYPSTASTNKYIYF